MKRILTIFLAAILFLDIISLGVLFFSGAGESKHDTDNNELFTKASVLVTGDNIAGEEINDQAQARGGSQGYDYSFAYESISDFISAADIAVLNQESIISNEHPISGYPFYNSPEALGDEMLKVGFDIINIANNHTLDYGEKGILNTIDYWNAKGADTTGAYADKETGSAVIKEVNGIKIAFLSFTETANDNSLPDDSTAMLVLSSYESVIYNLITSAKNQADIVVVLAHWGNEYETEVTNAQRNLAAKLGEWGADIIIGSHPHVIQPIEYITNPDSSKTIVAYSLGNLISTQTKGEQMLGGILGFDAVKNTQTGAITIENVKLNGVVTHYGVGMSKIRVFMLSDYTNELADVHGVKERTPDFSMKYLNNLLSKSVDKQFLR